MPLTAVTVDRIEEALLGMCHFPAAMEIKPLEVGDLIDREN